MENSLIKEIIEYLNDEYDRNKALFNFNKFQIIEDAKDQKIIKRGIHNLNKKLCIKDDNNKDIIDEIKSLYKSLRWKKTSISLLIHKEKYLKKSLTRIHDLRKKIK